MRRANLVVSLLHHEALSHPLVCEDLLLVEGFLCEPNLQLDLRSVVYDPLSWVTVVDKELLRKDLNSFTFFEVNLQET